MFILGHDFWAVSDEISIENPCLRLWFLRFSTLVVVPTILVLAALKSGGIGDDGSVMVMAALVVVVDID